MEKLLEKIALKTKIPSSKLAELTDLSKRKSTFIIQDLITAFPQHEELITQEYSSAFKIQIAHLRNMDIPSNIISLIEPTIATQLKVIPIDRVGNNIIIATQNPQDLRLMDNIRFKTGFQPKPVFATIASIDEYLQKYYGPERRSRPRKSDQKQNPLDDERILIGKPQSDPVMKLVDETLIQCVNQGASDIHFECYESYLRIRLRIDGALIEIARPPQIQRNQLISRIKIMADMDIAEKRLPQDGGIRTTINNKPIDFRVNSCPTIHGEKIVLRILDKSSLQVDMSKLGFEDKDFQAFKNAIHKPFGMVLVTGPTGSGKTTTLYSALQDLNRVSENIVTAEDPVEFNLEGINQVQVSEKINFSFSTALRAFLRQDPDIIMVGEIRDKITGEIAIKAALTGHLVLSTLHTNNASDTITRLLDMGLEPFNLTSSLNAIVAQRLVRKICESCREADVGNLDALIKLGLTPQQAQRVKIYKGTGCNNCSFSGYRGRIAVHEVLTISDNLRHLIMKNGSSLEIKQLAMNEGMTTLRQNATIKLLRGLTDIKEVFKNTASDDDEEAEQAA